jgi:hypothetical protein
MSLEKLKSNTADTVSKVKFLYYLFLFYLMAFPQKIITDIVIELYEKSSSCENIVAHTSSCAV